MKTKVEALIVDGKYVGLLLEGDSRDLGKVIMELFE